MELIKRNIELNGMETFKLKRIGINDKDTLTLIFQSSKNEELLINIHYDELKLLKNFLSRWD